MDASKGTAYEIEVADAVEAELAGGSLGLSLHLAKVRRKPSYFSRDRKKDIVFDVSVEVFRKDATEPYWIWVWECKNGCERESDGLATVTQLSSPAVVRGTRR